MILHTLVLWSFGFLTFWSFFRFLSFYPQKILNWNEERNALTQILWKEKDSLVLGSEWMNLFRIQVTWPKEGRIPINQIKFLQGSPISLPVFDVKGKWDQFDELTREVLSYTVARLLQSLVNKYLKKQEDIAYQTDQILRLCEASAATCWRELSRLSNPIVQFNTFDSYVEQVTESLEGFLMRLN